MISPNADRLPAHLTEGWFCPAPGPEPARWGDSFDPPPPGPCLNPLPCTVHNVTDYRTGMLIYGSAYGRGTAT